MARLARIVIPQLPHHVIQRGARRMQVFFSPEDYRTYVRLLGVQARRYDLDVWAYCLMPNHVHLIAVPATRHGLAQPLAEAHRRYAVHVNRREGWTGHLWQARFSSFPIDEPYLLGALRYVLLNPVRAGLAPTATAWPHSSARAHVGRATDLIVNTRPAANLVSDWASFLGSEARPTEDETFRRHSRVGRPLGSDVFIDELERITARRLRPEKVGRKRRGQEPPQRSQ